MQEVMPADGEVMLAAEEMMPAAVQTLFYFFGRERYSLHEATITTSKKCDARCIPLS